MGGEGRIKGSRSLSDIWDPVSKNQMPKTPYTECLNSKRKRRADQSKGERSRQRTWKRRSNQWLKVLPSLLAAITFPHSSETARQPGDWMAYKGPIPQLLTKPTRSRRAKNRRTGWSFCTVEEHKTWTTWVVKLLSYEQAIWRWKPLLPSSSLTFRLGSINTTSDKTRNYGEGLSIRCF